MRAGLTARFFGISIILTGLLMVALVFRNDVAAKPPARNVFYPRQASASVGSSPAAAVPSATPAESSTQQAASSSNTPAAPSTSQQQPAQTSTTPTSAAPQSTSQEAAQTTSPSTNAASAPTTPTTTFTSAVVTTDPGGQVVTSVVVISDSPPPSSAAPSQSSAASGSGSGGGGSGISSSTIIGLSVAGGVAVLCIVGFFVWKFTRKRLGDYDNNEEIKWPELNAHDTAVPLPTNRTGGAGFDTAPDARRSSLGYAPSTAANSTAELHPDPYAVPPLPHLDPNQPYHDDPNSRFYDPYRGPVPQSFEQPGGAGGQPGEAIPMTQLAGRRSPGPATAYAGGGGGGGGGEFAAASGRAVSPGPHAAYGSADFGGGGRASPAPPPGYSADFGGRASPGPRAPYAGGRVSPGPQAAYGNVYGPR